MHFTMKKKVCGKQPIKQIKIIPPSVVESSENAGQREGEEERDGGREGREAECPGFQGRPAREQEHPRHADPHTGSELSSCLELLELFAPHTVGNWQPRPVEEERPALTSGGDSGSLGERSPKPTPSALCCGWDWDYLRVFCAPYSWKGHSLGQK